MKGGVADGDGRLMQGDQILSVNGEDLKTATQENAATLLKVGVTCSESVTCLAIVSCVSCLFETVEFPSVQL